jgi:hypothetical protein
MTNDPALILAVMHWISAAFHAGPSATYNPVIQLLHGDFLLMHGIHLSQSVISRWSIAHALVVLL